ncbi:MAG: hypothetical protein WBP12_02740 [Candidatus Saccharimonas sp.]
MNKIPRPTHGKLIYDIIPPEVILASRLSAQKTHPVAIQPAAKAPLYADILAELANFPDFQEPELIVSQKPISITKQDSMLKLAMVPLQATKDFIQDIDWRMSIPVGRFIAFGSIVFISMTASFTTLKALSEGSLNATKDSKPSPAEKVRSDSIEPAATQPSDTTSEESTTPAASPATTTPTASTETTPTPQPTPEPTPTPVPTPEPTPEPTPQPTPEPTPEPETPPVTP